MEQLRAQLGNYLDWLERRGLTGTVAFRSPAGASLQTRPKPQSSDEEYALLKRDDESETTPRPYHSTTLTQPEALPEKGHALPLEAPVHGTGGTATAAPNVSSLSRKPPPGPQVTPPTSPQPEAKAPWKVGFYSSSDLTEEEFIMVSKIALALGLPAEDFHIWAEDSLVRVPVDLLRCSYIVALGPGSGQTLLALGQTVSMNGIQKALQGSPLVTIPHPRAMLREPSLKGGAWSALQKFKTLMLP